MNITGATVDPGPTGCPVSDGMAGALVKLRLSQCTRMLNVSVLETAWSHPVLQYLRKRPTTTTVSVTGTVVKHQPPLSLNQTTSQHT